MHQIQVNPSALRQTRWHEYAVRFAAGGFITAATGIIAKKFGPTIGGLFLAFPAIFPASATLIEKHELLKKRKHGLKGTTRARQLASIDGSVARKLYSGVVSAQENIKAPVAIYVQPRSQPRSSAPLLCCQSRLQVMRQQIWSCCCNRRFRRRRVPRTWGFGYI